MIWLIGLLAGLHVASWGAYKDAPFEGFRLRSYLRSIILATGAALGLSLGTTGRHLSLVIALGLIYTAERLITEWWKAIVREDNQAAYSIPMRLSVGGRPINRRTVRYTAGAVIAIALGGLAWATNTLQNALDGTPPWLVVPVVGGLGGWTTAIGGAWKDAPVEGFSGWKFLRSPAIATLWAVPLSLLTTNWVTLAIAAGGLAVASIETYKTFLTGGKPPGKFATRPVRFHYGGLRRVFVGVHIALWASFAATLAVGLAGPLQGLSGAWLAGLDQGLPQRIETTLTLIAAGVAALVAVANIRPVPAVVAP